MSHYIVNESGNATVNRSGMGEYAMEIYIALEATEHYAGFSGDGGSKKVNRETLMKALNYVAGNESLEQERLFILDCLENLDGSGEITVSFL